MLIRALCLLGLVALAGCPMSPRRFGGPTAPTYTGPAPAGGQGQAGTAANASASRVTAISTADPRQALNEVDRYMQTVGYQRIGPAVHNSSMPANGATAYAINARFDLCYTIIALSTPGNDLNLTVDDQWGRRITYNVSADHTPWATTCPGFNGRLTATLHMRSGQGEYYYAAYHGATRAQPNLAALFGAAQETGPQVATLDAATANTFRELDARMVRENYAAIPGERQGIVFREQEDRRYNLNLQEGFCYAFATVGGPGIQDTDAYLLDGGGAELDRDVSDQRDALVRFCPPQSGVYQLRALVYRGGGPLFAVGYQMARTPTETPAAPAQPVIGNTMAGAGLNENVRLLDSEMRVRGYQPYADPTQGQLNEGGTRDFGLQLEGGKCYAILAVGDNGVRDLDLRLLDGTREIDTDVEQGARPIVRVCPQRSGNFTMRVLMASGQGEFVYAPYRWPRGVRGPFGLEGLIYLRLAEVTSVLNLEGFEPDVDFEPGNGNAVQGQARNHDLRLAGGRCYSVLVVGGDGVRDLDVTLLEGNTSLETDGSHNAFPSVRHCTDDSGRFKLRVSAANGSGRYFYQVFRRTES